MQSLRYIAGEKGAQFSRIKAVLIVVGVSSGPGVGVTVSCKAVPHKREPFSPSLRNSSLAHDSFFSRCHTLRAPLVFSRRGLLLTCGVSPLEKGPSGLRLVLVGQQLGQGKVTRRPHAVFRVHTGICDDPPQTLLPYQFRNIEQQRSNLSC
ncbi:hypothetical protein CVT25_014345 [Psilocybe cyanescens]|uniref:Uncharacterized protein n=1 Tax=Psilocybe cyanescens TaxID=93625 RepID=A0A409WUA1_PSICY|nr:hypothetical protein CVT25_014345 [Psilocybe cyanescens]